MATIGTIKKQADGSHKGFISTLTIYKQITLRPIDADKLTEPPTRKRVPRRLARLRAEALRPQGAHPCGVSGPPERGPDAGLREDGV